MKLVVLEGDNIGPEVTQQAVRVFQVVQQIRGKAPSNQDSVLRDIEVVYDKIGGSSIDACGEAVSDEVLSLASDPSRCVAVLLGAVGGPQWDGSDVRPEEGLLKLRKAMNCYANIRPCQFPSESLIPKSPLKSAGKVDFVVVRELCGGIYFGERGRKDDIAFDTLTYSKDEVVRLTKVAIQLARQYGQRTGTKPKITSIDKANVLESSRLWRETVIEVMQLDENRDIELQHLYVDAAAMFMMKTPEILNGVVLCSNLFGDILSDQASAIVGSLGVSPSASISWVPFGDGERGMPGLYEPIHGSAPSIAGKGIANPIGSILSLAMLLRLSLNLPVEAVAVEDAVRKTLDSGLLTKDLDGNATTVQVGDKVCEFVREILGKITAEEYFALNISPQPHSVSYDGYDQTRRPMTCCEKILAHHAIGLQFPGNIKPNDMICVKVDWTLASELTWKGMDKTYNAINRPPLARVDRFWLAVDHTVDPSIMHEAKPKDLTETSEAFAREAGLKDYHGPNETILHTEFYRERVLPGQIVIGADSHSCSAGGLGSFAVGLGAADVVMPLVTGETWFKVPETVNIKFVGKPPFAIGGKDVILWVLGELKRNTVAFERAVEFSGPGCKYLSCDARFAISNMTTEFGGIAGVFEADELTAQYINNRSDKEFADGGIYFRADEDAQYAEQHVIDLSKVGSMVALYPSPDNVVPVQQLAGMKLDGVFIGACTTGEEDLILAALVLKTGLAQGYVPSLEGKRKVTPGSRPIYNKLKKLGLIEVYEKAGFEVGAPGCSYCLGIAADRAGEGEVWLSSQNRNFKNRMGKGSIGNLASAATVAASSFDMKVTDPQLLLDSLDKEEFKSCMAVWGSIQDVESLELLPVDVQEPDPQLEDAEAVEVSVPAPAPISQVIEGRVQLFGNHVDTDAIIPAEFMPGTSDEDLGTHCFQYIRSEFREKVQEGFNIVVAGVGFGSGSSREEAPRALLGCGVKAVIAGSYAYIYGRNQANMALLGIIPNEFDLFYSMVKEGSTIKVDVPNRVIVLVNDDGVEHSFTFTMSQMEESLISGGGVTKMFNSYGKQLFRVAMQPDNVQVTSAVEVVREEVRKIGGMVSSFIPKMFKPTKKPTANNCQPQEETW